MPVYAIDRVFSAGTVKSSSETQTIKANSGLVKQLRIFFPSGCINLVHIRIFYRGVQILPSNTDKEFIGDDLEVNLQGLDVELNDEPATIVISGWNTDTNTHQITGEIVIEPKQR